MAEVEIVQNDAEPKINRRKTSYDLLVTAIVFFLLSLCTIPTNMMCDFRIGFSAVAILIGIVSAIGVTGSVIVYKSNKNSASVVLIVIAMLLAFCPYLGSFVLFLGTAAMIIWCIWNSFSIRRGRAASVIVLGLIIYGYYSLPEIGKAGPLAKHAMSMTNLNGIGKAVSLYQSSNDDKLPLRIEQLVDDGYSACSCFRNPQSDQPPPKIVDGKFVGEVGYAIFLDRPEDWEGNSSDQIVGYEKKQYAYNGKIAVLLTSGKVVDMSLDELNEKLKAQGRPEAE